MANDDPTREGEPVRTSETRVGPYRVYARHCLPASPAAAELVLVHGMVVAGRGTLPLARALARRGFLVHLPDLPGFGRSDRPRRALDVAGLGAVLAEWAGGLGPGPVGLVGNSFGTQVAAAAAGRPGLASTVVLVSPTIDARFRRGWAGRLPAGRPGGPPRQGWRGRLRRAVVDRLVPDEAAPASLSLGNLLVCEYLAAGLGRALSTCRHALRDELTRSVEQIAEPVAVIRAGDDGLVSAAWAETVARAAGRGSVREVPHVGHDSQFDQPDVLADAVVAAGALSTG